VNQNDIAYIAGLFDGEGSVSYYQRKKKQKNKKKAYNYWVIRCEMSMTDQYVMEWFYKTLDVGTLTKRLPTKSWVGRKMQWRWRCGYRDAYSFANLSPVNPATILRGNVFSLPNAYSMDPLFKDTAESLTTDVWNIFFIGKRLRGQKLLQFQITNNSGGESNIDTAFMRLV